MKVAVILLGFYTADVPDLTTHEAVLFLTTWYGTPGEPGTSPGMEVVENFVAKKTRFTIAVCYSGTPHSFHGRTLEEALVYCPLAIEQKSQLTPFLRAVLIRHLCPHFRMVGP